MFNLTFDKPFAVNVKNDWWESELNEHHPTLQKVGSQYINFGLFQHTHLDHWRTNYSVIDIDSLCLDKRLIIFVSV